MFVPQHTDPYRSTEAGKLSMNKADKRWEETHPINLLLDWLIFYLHEKHISLAKTSYCSLRSSF